MDEDGAMRTVDITNPHRRRHFDFFRAMNHPHFNVCANVSVGKWLAATREQELRTTPSMVYLLARTANEIPELRRRIRGEELVEHEVVHPSFSVQTDVADVFSFCEVEFAWDARTFVQRAEGRMEAMKTNPSFEDEGGRDDYLFMSPFPWVSFTAMQHAMMYHPHDSVPRISWGKFTQTSEATTMPLSLQVHHAVVDGVHVGRFFQRVEALASAPEEVLTASIR